MSEARILLAENDPAVRKVIEGLLVDAGFAVEAAADGLDGLERFERAARAGAPPDAVLADVAMPRLDGIALLDRLKALDPEVLVIFVTAYSSIDSAVAALRKGAYDYVAKPFRNDQLLQIVRNAVTQRRLFAENRTLRREIERAYGFQEIVGRSPSMAAVFRVIERAAPTSASNPRARRDGHGEGARRARRPPRVAARRPAVRLDQLRGAARGASRERALRPREGRVLGRGRALARPLSRRTRRHALPRRDRRDAAGAPGEAPPRARDARGPAGRVDRNGARGRADRLGHNRDLLGLVQAGRFREDLYYRFAVIEVEVPPLRARPDDILLLARHFLRKIARDRGEPERKLAPDAIERLLRYP